MQQVGVAAAAADAVDGGGDPLLEGVLAAEDGVLADALAQPGLADGAVLLGQGEVLVHPQRREEPPGVADLAAGCAGLDSHAAGDELLGAVGGHAAQFDPGIAQPHAPLGVVVEHQPAHADGVEALASHVAQIAVQAQRQQQLQRARLARAVGPLEDDAAAGEVELLVAVLPHVDHAAAVQPPPLARAHGAPRG
ncbi:hypothetical protein ACFQZ2_21155, partial [Streptomonospora algeriensis]